LAGKITTGLVESNGSLLSGRRLKVTSGLTACSLGSAPGSMLSNQYGKTYCKRYFIATHRCPWIV